MPIDTAAIDKCALVYGHCVYLVHFNDRLCGHHHFSRFSMELQFIVWNGVWGFRICVEHAIGYVRMCESKVFTFCFKTLVSVWSIDVASKSVRASGTAIVINLYLLVHTQHTFILFFFVPSPVLYYRTLNLSTIEHSKNICLFVQYVRSNRRWHTMPMAADGGQWKQKYIFFSSFFADAFLDK